MSLTLTQLSERYNKGEDPILLSPSEFFQYVDIIMPDDSLLGPYLAGSREKYEEDRKKFIKQGWAVFRGRIIKKSVSKQK